MQSVIAHFQLGGMPLSCEPFGSGHINRTYLVATGAPHLYILQQINHRVFQNVPALMENIRAVTQYLAQKDPDPRHVLTLVPTADGRCYTQDAEGNYWRMYEYVTGGLCLNRAETPEEFAQSAVAFGRFQTMLKDFPAATLHETIARFHDTPNRYRALHAAAEENVAERRAGVEEELAFFYAREGESASLTGLLAAGELPLRVTHNDTKLNNVILDETTHEALCVIDLDTVMPGLVAYDFGDSIRFGASTAAEDEKDTTRVHLSMPMYEAYVKGFLSVCGTSLTARETETLPVGAKMMTLENGVRFLTDYLQGDPYYAISRPEHNLDRCRTQIALVADMEKKWAEMNAVIRRYAVR